MKIERMKISDLDQIMAIEKISFLIPWEKSFFEYDLRRKQGYCYVVKENEKVIGYTDAWHVADEVHLANIAVTPSYRHTGIGSKMLAKIIEDARKISCHKIYLEVRVSNSIAQKFYEKFGFIAIYKRVKYYPDGEDAIVYEKRLQNIK
jgi:ribosomal-protein-alanine N-acetyltransferase